MPAPALPQPHRDVPLAKPVVGEPREVTVAVGEPRTVTVEADR